VERRHLQSGEEPLEHTRAGKNSLAKHCGKGKEKKKSTIDTCFGGGQEKKETRM